MYLFFFNVRFLELLPPLSIAFMTYVSSCIFVTRGMNVVYSELVIVWNETDMEPFEVGFRDLFRRTADIHEIIQLLLSMSRCELTASVFL